MDYRWFSVVGLLFDIAGAIALACGLIISRSDAIELGVSRYSGSTDEENLELTQVQDRLKQSRNAKIGLVLLILGFSLQLVGSWPR